MPRTLFAFQVAELVELEGGAAAVGRYSATRRYDSIKSARTICTSAASITAPAAVVLVNYISLRRRKRKKRRKT